MQMSRLFEIVYILLDKKHVTAGELAEYFGVSRRTICRDIDTLCMSGIPIYTERGKGGGIRLLPDFVLNKTLLSENEQTEILSALHGLSSIKPKDTNPILSKLSTIFNKSTTNWMEVDLAGWSHENNYYNDFKFAILEKHVIEFDYFNGEGGKTFHRVEPLQIRFKSKSWYLKGFCLIKQDIRLYKVSRIKNLTVTNERYEVRDLLIPSESFDSYTNDSQNTVAMKLHIQPEMTYRVLDDFYENMVEQQPDGSFMVTVSWPVNDWLYGFILSFGRYIEVIEPEHLRYYIKEESQRISEKYT